MKFQINRNIFYEKLMVASKAMAQKSNMPALTGFLVECYDNEITIITSNSEISIQVKIDDSSLMIEDNGTVLIPGKLFGEIVRKLSGETLEIELEDDNMLRIQSGNTDSVLNLFDSEDYPKPDFKCEFEPIRMKTALLKEIIKETTFASSTIDNKPILTGVNVRIFENNLLAVATDSFRLSKRNTTLNESYLDTNVIIPARSLNELFKVLDDETGYTDIYPTQSKIVFISQNIVFQARLLDGNYPDTSRLIPTSFPVVLKFNKEDLISSIDRVSTLSNNPNATTVVKLVINEDGKTTIMSSYPELGTIKDQINPTEIVQIEPLTISFSATYFLDALRAFYSEEIYVKFNGEIKPFIFEADNDEGLIELVLPMKSD